ncbi:hypothetical protein SNEBB_006657 [Seison nebaliae]|nr:hypothetical protein SNEBB_006657 [Seison nebaliae]
MPTMSVVGTNFALLEDISKWSTYPPNKIRSLAASFLSFLKIIVIFFIVFNVNIFSYFGLETPNFWNSVLQSKVQFCLLVFITVNVIENALLSTGAFEIEAHGITFWSKLQSGRPPSDQEFLDIAKRFGEMRYSV